MVICLQRGADLHMAQLMLLPLTVSCFSKIQIGFTFLVLGSHLGSPGKRAVKRLCVCVCVCVCLLLLLRDDVKLNAYRTSVSWGDGGWCRACRSAKQVPDDVLHM